MDLNIEMLEKMFDLKEIDIDNNIILKEVNINITSEEFYDYLNSKIGVDRLGEVVFAFLNNNKILLVRQDEYPEGIYRIPSGGIGINEKVLHALKREVIEELGYNIKKYKFIGAIKYNLIYINNYLTFYSFVFLIEDFVKDNNAEIDGEISEVYFANMNEINNYLFKIKEQKGFWGDWGKLRYESTFIVYEYLNK
ncbi:NUDIX hydrolase [Caldicellulosiruptoraceae bacterium PP1]